MKRTAFLVVDGCTLECAWFHPTGNDDSRHTPVVVMLHEGLGSVAMWKQFPHELAAATGCSVLAYSRYGYGMSEPQPGPRDPLRMHEHEALVVLPSLLKQLNIHRPILFGHSDGASIALIYAGVHREALRGAIVLAPHVMVEPMCLDSIRAAKHTYLTTDLRQKLARYHANPDSAFWGWNDLWLNRLFADWTIESYLPAIACPLLAIQGFQDEYGTMQQLELIAAAHTDTSVLKLGECGHSPHRDQPAAVLEASAQFIRRLTAGTTDAGRSPVDCVHDPPCLSRP